MPWGSATAELPDRRFFLQNVTAIGLNYKSSMVFVQMKARSFSAEVFTLTYMPNLESIRR